MIQHASIDDSTLFERITRHDAEAFGIVMRRYAGALYAFAFRIVGDTLAAEDIVQEVFINLWEKRRKLSPGPSLRNFLYLAVRNLSLNHLRMQKNHLAQTNAYLFEQKAGLWVIEEERYRLLSEAIKQLPPRTATVIGYSCFVSLRKLLMGEAGLFLALPQKTTSSSQVKKIKARGSFSIFEYRVISAILR